MAISDALHPLRLAMLQVEDTYGDRVSVEGKLKTLLKFGKNNSVGTGFETVWTIGDDETYATTNAIDSISSSNSGDSQAIKVEGHTVTGTGTSAQYTFVVQEATLNGQSKVTLSTPLARCSRMYNNSATAIAGTVNVYEDSAITNGVPNDMSKVHAQILGGDSENQSFKAATTFSDRDYFFLTSLYGSVGKKTSAHVDLVLERMAPGKTWLPIIQFEVAEEGGVAKIDFDPVLIIPKNYDVRIRAAASTTNVEVDAGFHGYIAKVTS